MKKQAWYAIQVSAGRERTTAELCQKLIETDILIECFIPQYERKRRYEGQWHIEKLPLFPGYIFMVTERIGELFQRLKQVPELTKILGIGIEFVPLEESEMIFLNETGGEKHLIKMSQGYMVGSQVRITSGPMEKLVGKIAYLDRHKRIAVVQIQMFGRSVNVRMGLEIVGKY